MADLNEILNTIATAIYGKDVRQSIYDAIDFIHNEYLTIKTVADQMHELIAMYEDNVAQAKQLTGKLDEQITTGTELKESLADLSATLSDGREVLAELKTENGKATTNIQEAEEKIEIIQGLLAQFPDLDTASEIATHLEAAYNGAVEAVSMIEPVEALVEQLKQQNTDAETNLANFEQAKSDLENLKQTVQEMSEQVANYPQIIEELNAAYQTALEALAKLGEAQETGTHLEELNTEAQSNLDRYDQAKTEVDTLIEKTTQLEEAVSTYPDIIQRLDDAYAAVKDTVVDLEELQRLLASIDTDAQIINENKESITTLVNNMDMLKLLASKDLDSLIDFEERLTKLEAILAGLEEEFESLI